MYTNKSGIDGCNFELILLGIDKERFFSPQPLLNHLGKKYGEIGIKRSKVCISVNLPKIIRNDNVQPFSITDMIKLDFIRNDLESNLQRLVGDTFNNKLTSIECNITQPVSVGSKCYQVLNLINRSFYEGTNTVYQRASNDCKYLKEEESVIIRKKNYYLLKCYNKSLEQKDAGNTAVEDNLLRIEVVMLDRVLKDLFGNKSSIGDVFKKNTLMKVIDEYKRIFTVDVVDGHIIPCLKDITNILFESLKETESQVETIARHKKLIVDEEVFRKALVMWHKYNGKTQERAENNADAYISRAGKYGFPKNVVDTIREFKKSCG